MRSRFTMSVRGNGRAILSCCMNWRKDQRIVAMALPLRDLPGFLLPSLLARRTCWRGWRRVRRKHEGRRRDRESVGEGQSVAGREAFGGRHTIQKKKNIRL